MPAKSFTEFELGLLCAASIIARRDEDGLATELMGVIGVRKVSDIQARGLEQYDKEPLVKILRENNR